MLVKIFGSAVYGVEAITITVEVNWMATGKDCLIVGLPDNAVKESMQRVESAIKKSGTAFDLPIAIGVLAASEQMKDTAALNNYVMMGELSLDGTLRPIKG